MARTDLTTQVVVPSGLEPTYEAANVDGNAVLNNGVEFVHVINGGGGAIVVTVETPATAGGLAIADQTVSVPAGEDRMIGPFDASIYGQSGSDRGKVHVDYDSVTSVTVAALRI